MMARWPDDLPRPLQRGFAGQRQDARAPRSVETGPALRRRRFSSAARLLSFTLLVDPDQQWRLEHFYAVTLQEGTQPFRMAQPDRDGLPLLTASGEPLLTESDLPILLARERTYTFGSEPPSVSAVRGRWRDMSFVLMEMP